MKHSGGWAILVVWDTGSEEYVREGLGLRTDPVARFRSKLAAEFQADFMKIGMGDAQSINVVRFPKATP